MERLAGKAHPNIIYEIVSLFKSEQAATEVTLMQVYSSCRGLPVRKRSKYRNHERKLVTIKEKYEVGDYTLSELVKAYSH